MPVLLLPTALLLGWLSLPAAAADWLYLTVPGDTLIGIGKQYLKNPNDWPKVQSENGVETPRQLPAHTRLKIPVGLLKVTPAPVTVTAVNGNVRIKSGDGPFRALQASETLNGGESVLTGPRSSAAYRFADGTTLTQQASSKLGFGRLAAYGKTGMVSTEISLDSGRLEAHAGKQIAPAGGFQVKTPVAVAGLRGTDFRLNVSEDGQQLSNEVLEGAVGIAARGKEVRVAAGYGVVTQAGRAPSAPRELPAAPILDAPLEVFPRLPATLNWRSDATTWRVQVAADADFTTPLIDEVTRQPVVRLGEELPDSAYFLRLRAIAEDGLEGLNTQHAFRIDARPLPPVPVAPALGERLYQAQASFAWSAVPEAHGYVLQIAATPEFNQGVIERRLPAVIQHQETLDESEWHWRVASIDAAGKTRLFSPHRAFRVQFPPGPPAAASSQADNGHARFTWSPVRGAARYAIEVSDAGKQNTVNSAEIHEPAHATPLAPGQYAWRVRGLEADGRPGNWSNHNTVILPPTPPRDVKVNVTTTPVTLTWQGDAPRYRYEIARDAAFSQIVAQGESSAAQASVTPLAPGTYQARVTALGPHGANSLPSAPAAFTVERKPWWLLLLLLPLL